MCKNSTATRVAYAVLFLLSSITAWVMLDPTVARDLQKVRLVRSFAKQQRRGGEARRERRNGLRKMTRRRRVIIQQRKEWMSQGARSVCVCVCVFVCVRVCVCVCNIVCAAEGRRRRAEDEKQTMSGRWNASTTKAFLSCAVSRLFTHAATHTHTHTHTHTRAVRFAVVAAARAVP